MGRIGRVRPQLGDLVDLQMERKLRNVGFYRLKDEVGTTSSESSYVTTLRESSNLAVESSSTSGYDYTVDPPVATNFADVESRLDNLDEYLLTLPALLESAGSVLLIVQYIPDGAITELPPFPNDIVACRVYRNGLRLYEGADYDYTFAGNIISVSGNAGDRFVVEYNAADSS